MKKKVVILTEKPSVAKQFALALKAEQKSGYYENNDYIITFSFGHLFEMDDSILPKKWEWQTLPIIIKEPKYRIKTKDKKGTPDIGSLRQFKIISNLLKNTDMVINAGDAGREGELIQRIILQQSRYNMNVKRFWTSEALTEGIIKKTLQSLRNNAEYDSLYYSAISRQVADAMIGFNLTRAITLINQEKTVLHIGRVQTPTLTFIYDRNEAIQNHKKEEYFVVSAIFNTLDTTQQKYKGYLFIDNKQQKQNNIDENKEDDINNIEDIKLTAQQAEQIKQYLLQHQNMANVVNITNTIKTQYPPVLHSLTSLQRECNTLYGYTANETLQIAQSLYDPPLCLISYPRTDSNYMGENNVEIIAETLKKLGCSEQIIKNVRQPGKRMFDNSKLTDHHAIIPLDKIKPEHNLNEKQINVYSLVARKLIGMYCGDYIYEDITVLTAIDKFLFKSKGKINKSLGWMVLYKEKQTSDIILPKLSINQKVKVDSIDTERKETQPPPYFTEASLLKMMEKYGLGTPATRAGIIENLKYHGYIYIKNKKIFITDKGIGLIKLLKQENIDIYKPDITAQWEEMLDKIYKENQQKKGYINFINNISEYVIKILGHIKNISINISNPHNLKYKKNEPKQKYKK